VAAVLQTYLNVGIFLAAILHACQNHRLFWAFEQFAAGHRLGTGIATSPVVVLKTDIQETLEETAGCPATCASPADCQGLDHCTAAKVKPLTAIVLPPMDDDEEPQSKNFTSTRNACKLCTPLGACLAFRGVEGCIPFLHGSQGCSTYIRRYLISHFREPIDIASSNFHEDSAIFGGSKNFAQGALNVTRQYQPQLIGAATTCLAETIGEDMARLQHELKEQHGDAAAPIVHVSTASYRGTHIDGFHSAVRELVEQLAVGERTPPACSFQRPAENPVPHTSPLEPTERMLNEGLGATPNPARETRALPIALFPGMVSTADLRHLKEIFADFNLPFILLPDYSESMDGATWSEYEKLQSGGTPISAIRALGSAQASIEFGRTLAETKTGGTVLQSKFSIPRQLLGLPMGIRESDAFFNALAEIVGVETPVKYQRERGRLVDSLIDGHKYAFEKRAIVFGEEDLVIGLTALLCEIGVTPVLCASGGRSKHLEKCLRAAVPDLPEETLVKEGFDFAEIAEAAPGLKPDFLIGSSKGYSIARRLKVPLIRVGFPIHDRIGGQRVLHLGYRGAQELFDRIINALLEVKQETSPIGYSYL
jgi:nitrogenase molybdenum-iron protein NifN